MKDFHYSSITAIFPPTKSQPESSESNERLPTVSHSISVIYPPAQSQTESSESNERLPPFSNIWAIFPPTKSHTESSESNERSLTRSSYSIPSPFKPNSLRTHEHPDKETLQQRLQMLIDPANRNENMGWTYAIYWKFSNEYSRGPFLKWGVGLLSSGSVADDTDDDELTSTEWFFQVSKMQSFVNGSGLPGQAFINSSLVWVTGADRLASWPCERARHGQLSGLQTMVCVPLVDGVVELGSTELIHQSSDLMNNLESNSWPIIGPGITTPG
uniref:Transcription factor n=1 Tax=Fagus sylvatica TaxID=28930 RepID=A0A2N9F4K0_FAGSY